MKKIWLKIISWMSKIKKQFSPDPGTDSDQDFFSPGPEFDPFSEPMVGKIPDPGELQPDPKTGLKPDPNFFKFPKKPAPAPGQEAEILKEIKSLKKIVESQKEEISKLRFKPAPAVSDPLPDPEPEPDPAPDPLDPILVETEIRKSPATVNSIKGALNNAGYPDHVIYYDGKQGVNTKVFAMVGNIRVPVEGFFNCFIAVDKQVEAEKKNNS